MDYSKELEFAKKLAKQADDISMKYFGGDSLGVDWKPEDNTPVTVADKEINKIVIESVKQNFPGDGVLGEEESHNQNNKRLWVVDPIDGTQPYSIGVPTFTFSVGFVQDNEAVLGVISDPVLDKLHWSKDGRAYCSNQQIIVNNAETLSSNYAVVSSRMGEGHRETGEVYDAIIAAGGKAFNLRSIIYGFMLVATGRAVASMAGYCKPWDIAAALPILKAAGAKVTDFDGNNIKFGEVSNGILVTNGKVHDQMIDVIKP